MIKIITNKTTKPNIKIESKFIKNKNEIIKEGTVSNITKEDYMFVKITFSGLEEREKINQINLDLVYENAPTEIGVKVIKCDSTNIEDQNIKSLVKEINEEEVIEQAIIYGNDDSLNKTGIQIKSLDITNIIKKEIKTNPTVMIAINFPYGTLNVNDFKVYMIEEIGKTNKICEAVIKEIGGLTKIYEYDEHYFGRCGDLYINLATGKPIYKLDIIKSKSENIPIKFTIYQKEGKGNKEYLKNKVVPNFSYQIHSYLERYILEDPTGLKRYYNKIELEENTKEELIKTLGIKNIIEDADLYYSLYDYSYMYVKEDTNTKIDIYDKYNNHMYFLIEEEQLNIKTYYYNNESKEIINDVKLCFNNNMIEKVIDVITGNFMYILNHENKVMKVIMYNKTATEKKYETSYIYEKDYTKIQDIEKNNLYYYFDNYGRVKTIIDDEARSITYNYDLIEKGESRNLVGVSKVQNNARNLIINHSFEDENIFLGDIGWKKEGFVKSEVGIIDEGVIGERSLRIETKENVTVYQDIVNLKPGKYNLKGFIKHQKKEEINQENIKVRLIGKYQQEENEIKYNQEAKLEFSKEEWYQFETPELIIPEGANNIEMRLEIIAQEIDIEILIDDLQLTNSKYFTRYNLIENGYMEFIDENNMPIGWEFENLEEEDKIKEISEEEIHKELLGKNVMRLTPNEENKLRRMYRKIPIKGLASEELMFSVIAKASLTNNMVLKAYMKIKYENEGIKYQEFEFIKHITNWQVLTRQIITEDNYNEVEVGIEYIGGVEVLLDGFQLYKDSFGKNYNYDKLGNITEVIEDTNNIRITYDENNNIKEVYRKDGGYYRYYYEENKLKKIKDLNGVITNIEYENDKIRTFKTTTKEGVAITNSVSYDNENNLETYKNEFSNEHIIKKDYLNKIIEEIDTNGFKKTYDYDNKEELIKINWIIDEIKNSQIIEYDLNGNIKKVKTVEGIIYEIEYDDFSRIKEIKNNNKTLEKYEYDPVVDKYSKGNLIKKTICEAGDIYEYEYNEKGQEVKVKLNGKSLIEYNYDENGNIYGIKDKVNDISTYYTYDLKGNLIKKETSEGDKIKYTYDNLGNIETIKYKMDSKLTSVEYDYEYEINEYSKEGYYNRLSKMYGDEIVILEKGIKGQYGGEEIASNYEETEEEIEFKTNKNYITYDTTTFNRNRGITNGNLITKEQWDLRFRYNKTIYMIIKPIENYGEVNLISLGKSKDNLIEIYWILKANSDGTISYKINDNEEKKTITKLEINKWNLVGIKIYKRLEKYEAEIIINEEKSEAFGINIKVEEINRVIISSQEKKDDETLKMSYKVCLISFGAYNYLEEDFKAIYKEGIRYLNQEIEGKINSTRYYNNEIYKGYDVITLNNQLESIKGVKPEKMMTIDKSYRIEKAQAYKYDIEEKRHIYGSYNGIVNLTQGNKTSLMYKLPLTIEGTIILRFKQTEQKEEKNQIISIVGEKEELGIYIDEANKIKVRVKEKEENLKELIIKKDTWYKLIIRYNKNKIEVIVDDIKNKICEKEETINIEGKEVYIGNSKDNETALNGLIEMFAYKGEYEEEKRIEEIIKEGNIIVISKEKDEINRVKKEIIKIKDKEIIKEYMYDKTRIYGEIKEEKKNYYTYDKKSNITSKTEIENGITKTRTYIYDTLGRIKKEIKNEIQEEIEYGENNNIKYKTKKNKNEEIVKLEYEYDSIIKDKLIKVKDILKDEIKWQITYSTENKYLPISIYKDGKTNKITWEGKRLKGINDDIKYEYNTSGIRIKKETPNEISTYKVEGNRIIKMNKVTSKEDVILEFIYDSNSILVGVNTKEDNYFYVRDIMGNIEGIIDSKGEYIVKYRYNGWGEIESKEVIKDLIVSRHNPFMYKGYYYDEETELYWVSSRYYSPELCRWISPDSIEYLDPSSINGLNLYCYCMNNPIMYSDPSGHMPEWLSTTLKIVGGVAIIAGCVVGSIFTGGALSVVLAGAAIGAAAGGIGAGISTVVSGGDIHDFANSFLMSTATGAISGAIAASPLGVGAQIGINAALGAVNYAGTQLLSGGNITLGGLIVNAGIGALCGWIGQSGWMQGQTTSAFVAFAGKNTLKHVVGMVGTETLLRMTLPAFLLGGVGGGIYGRLSSQFNPNGNFIGI